MKSIHSTAILMSMTTPIEIWAGIELDKGNYILGLPLMAASTLLAFFGIRKWICTQTEEIDKEIDKDLDHKS